MLGADGLNRSDTIHFRHLQIHERDVGSMTLKALDCLDAVFCLSDDRHVGFTVDHRYDAFAHQRMIVDDENADSLAFRRGRVH